MIIENMKKSVIEYAFLFCQGYHFSVGYFWYLKMHIDGFFVSADQRGCLS